MAELSFFQELHAREGSLCNTVVTDRSETLRRLIRRGLADWKKERSLEQLRDHEITVRKAAEMADVAYVEMVTLAAKEGLDVGYELTDLEEDLDRI